MGRDVCGAVEHGEGGGLTVTPGDGPATGRAAAIWLGKAVEMGGISLSTAGPREVGVLVQELCPASTVRFYLYSVLCRFTSNPCQRPGSRHRQSGRPAGRGARCPRQQRRATSPQSLQTCSAGVRPHTSALPRPARPGHTQYWYPHDRVWRASDAQLDVLRCRCLHRRRPALRPPPNSPPLMLLLQNCLPRLTFPPPLPRTTGPAAHAHAHAHAHARCCSFAYLPGWPLFLDNAIAFLNFTLSAPAGIL